jgi:hypothetical protein
MMSTALISRPLVAQMGNASAIHTVSVTIPPRVKVQVSSFAASSASSTSMASKPAGGVAVSVTATQPWILSIGAAKKNARSVKWSRSEQGGYAALSPSQTTLASGEHGTTSADATVFISADSADDTPVVLTIAAQ